MLECTILWLLCAFQNYETSKSAINIFHVCAWKVSLRSITHSRLRILPFQVPSLYLQHTKCYFLSSGEKISRINTAATGALRIQKVMFFQLPVSFQAHTLKQCPIKKLHKVAIGKTILKSTASANKPAGPLSLYPAKRKLVRIRKAIIDSLKTLDAHISGLRCKVKC